jgi:hypothetical protein
MTIYIDYEYLAAEQLGTLLAGLHGLFDEILYADFPAFRTLPNAPRARLRIETVATGNSITLSLVPGITQVVTAPGMAMTQLAGGAAALFGVARLVLGLAGKMETLRAKVLRDNRENELGKLEVKAKNLEVQSKQQELIPRPAAEPEFPRTDLSDILAVLQTMAPDRSRDQQEALAERLKPPLDMIIQVVSDKNIRIVRVNISGQRKE